MRVWTYIGLLFLVLWSMLAWSGAQQLVGDQLPGGSFVSMNSVQSTGNVYIVRALAVATVVSMAMETAAAIKVSLLLRCGDIEPNPGPLTREGETTYCFSR